MNTYVKQFLHRGLIFGGFGPIIVSVVYAILAHTVTDFSLSGMEVLVAVLSSYVLAFVHAGVSVFNQIESWSIGKSLFFHFLSLYVVYAGCYLLNGWIPFDLTVFLVFSVVFVVLYAVIWTVVYLSVKRVSGRLNKRLP